MSVAGCVAVCVALYFPHVAANTSQYSRMQECALQCVLPCVFSVIQCVSQGDAVCVAMCVAVYFQCVAAIRLATCTSKNVHV